MQCKNAKRKLSALIDGELAPSLREEVQDHLASCGACRQAFEGLSQTWEMIRTVPPASKPAPYLYTRIRARLDAEESVSPIGFWRRLVVPLTSAVVVALGVFFGSQIGVNGHGDTALAAEDYFGSVYLDAFQDFPTASLGAVYFADASEGGEE
jgi:predicted anti-sigma-YlaC factor YlaD